MHDQFFPKLLLCSILNHLLNFLYTIMQVPKLKKNYEILRNSVYNIFAS